MSEGPETPLEGSPGIAIEILYEDAALAVINKPAGIVTDRSDTQDGGDTVQDLAALRWPQLKKSLLPRPGIVHRLDKETSGLLVLALTDEIHQKLSQQFIERTVKKLYKALVEGSLDEAVEIDLPIGRSNQDRKKMGVISGGKPAVTQVEPIRRLGAFSMIEVRIFTGRTHQIRVHLAYLKHPIVGDSVYGARQRIPGLNRPFLHASVLEFTHPDSGKELHFQSELPYELEAVLESLQNST